MNRYKNLISNIIGKQEKILSESKIGTIFNEGRWWMYGRTGSGPWTVQYKYDVQNKARQAAMEQLGISEETLKNYNYGTPEYEEIQSKIEIASQNELEKIKQTPEYKEAMKKIEKERSTVYDIISTYKDTWNIIIGSLAEINYYGESYFRDKHQYVIGTITDAEGKDLTAEPYHNSVPQKLTIYTMGELPDVLSDVMTKSIEKKVNEVVSGKSVFNSRNRTEWRPKNNPHYKQRYSTDLPKDVKLPISISNIHK